MKQVHTVRGGRHTHEKRDIQHVATLQDRWNEHEVVYFAQISRVGHAYSSLLKEGFPKNAAGVFIVRA